MDRGAVDGGILGVGAGEAVRQRAEVAEIRTKHRAIGVGRVAKSASRFNARFGAERGQPNELPLSLDLASPAESSAPA